ncbi:hypothetical protein [Methylobacterium sp. A54F]
MFVGAHGLTVGANQVCKSNDGDQIFSESMMEPIKRPHPRRGPTLADPTRIANPYRTAFRLAWRNAMVATINVGLERSLFGLSAGENHWPEAEADAGKPRPQQSGALYRYTVLSDVEAVAWIYDGGFDEIAVHVVLWPTIGAEQTIRDPEAWPRAGKVVAFGRLERRVGTFLQSAPVLYVETPAHTEMVASIGIDPLDGRYLDRGRVQP